MRSWETDCRSWGFCGQQEFFPPSYRRTRIQRDTMGSKEALLAANITFCVGAAWRDPWCFLEGIFSVKRPMKELTITLAECYRMKKYEFMLFAVLGLKSQNRHWQKEGDIAPLAGYHPPPFFFKPQEGNGGNELCSRYFLNSKQSEWHHAKIPKQALSSMKEKWVIRPSTCRLRHRGIGPARRRGTHRGMFDPSIKQRWLMGLYLLRNRVFTVGKITIRRWIKSEWSTGTSGSFYQKGPRGGERCIYLSRVSEGSMGMTLSLISIYF